MANICKNVRYREALRTDVPAIGEIFSYYIVNTTATWRYDYPGIEWMYNWYDHHIEINKPIWVACIDDLIIGYACLSEFRSGEGYWRCAENTVYIKPEYCDSGIGRRLMEILIDLASALKIQYFMALIDDDNAGSIRFHKSLGFETNTVIKQIGNKFNRNLDLNLMVLNLNKEI